jgi:ATP-binding cassette subfamily B protein
MSSGLVSFDRVMTVVKENREPLDTGSYLPENAIGGALEFEKVGFAYDDAPDTPVLQDISFSVKPGQVIALLGSTGSGKTTLANLLPRFYEYTCGKILLDGVELKRYPRNFLRSQIGTVEQEPFLFSRTIRENITYGVDRQVTQEEVEDAAKAAAVHEAILTFPDKYNTLVGEKGVTLSGGQKQRVAIARTIIKNPRILILDDATSSVDVETEADIRSALEKLMEGRTTFIIAHRIQSVMKADLIVVLDKGRIIQVGAHQDLSAQEGVYRKIHDIQTQIEDQLEKEIASAGMGV